MEEEKKPNVYTLALEALYARAKLNLRLVDFLPAEEQEEAIRKLKKEFKEEIDELMKLAFEDKSKKSPERSVGESNG